MGQGGKVRSAHAGGSSPPPHLQCPSLRCALLAFPLPLTCVRAGEHMHEFEGFEAQKFVGRLLGKGDWGGFIDKVKDVIPEVGGGGAWVGFRV